MHSTRLLRAGGAGPSAAAISPMKVTLPPASVRPSVTCCNKDASGLFVIHELMLKLLVAWAMDV